jgi:DNA-binding response OmpR family regulator
VRKPIRLLLIEDDEDSRAECGRTALAIGPEVTFDIVLTDLGLPDIPGDVLLRALLARATVRPRIIVMTGYGEPHLTRARDSGADVILLKPIDWVALRAHLLREPRAAA